MTEPLFQELPFAKVDLDRARRRGFPEVIYARSKSVAQVVAIAEVLLRNKQPVVVTKVSPSMARALSRRLPWLRYFPKAKMAVGLNGTRYKNAHRVPGLRPGTQSQNGTRHRIRRPLVLVVTAGTSDIPVAEEAVVILESMGHRVKRLFDVGVAGLHRLLKNLSLLRRARAIVVVAGMDGALPSVISGLVRSPVVAVPTSIGYGASFKGIAPLLTMMNNCSPGVAVVNIDNGFGAGYLAALIARDPLR